MKEKAKNKVILTQWADVLIILAAIIILIFSILSIVKSFSQKSDVGKDLYNYSYNSNLDYKVYLRQNNFFTVPYIGMNKQYITSLIDHIDVDVKYDFKASEELNYTYNYEIVATTKGIYSESEGAATEIWSKTYQISPIETKSAVGRDFAINKTVTIDYNKYNDIMNDFRNQFGLSVDSRVDLEVKINITGGLSGAENSMNESYTMALQIPLLKPTIQLKPDYVNSGTQSVKQPVKASNKKVNLPLLLFGFILLLASLYVIKIYAKKLLSATKKSEYLLQFNKIFKEYTDIVAMTDNLPDLTKYDIVSVKHFNDLVDIEEELHSPILCTEIRPELESWFIILYDKTAYRYILKYENFGNIINDK